MKVNDLLSEVQIASASSIYREQKRGEARLSCSWPMSCIGGHGHVIHATSQHTHTQTHTLQKQQQRQFNLLQNSTHRLGWSWSAS